MTAEGNGKKIARMIGKTVEFTLRLITALSLAAISYLGFNSPNGQKIINDLLGKTSATGTPNPVDQTPPPTAIPPFPTTEPSPMPEATATGAPPTPEAPKLPRLDQGEWPTTAKDFLAAVQVPEDQIPSEYKNDPYYRPLQEGMITLEYDVNGKPTGGVQVLFERNAEDGDKFPFVVIRNSSGVMQYGVMHDPILRLLAGFRAEEVAALGIGNNHIGSGIPVTGDSPVAVEGLTFYPKVNSVDGSGNVHFIWTALGENMQTMDQRLARSAGQSSILEDQTNPFSPLKLAQGNVTVIVNGSPVNFDGNDEPIYKANRPHALGGGQPSRITSARNLSKEAKAFQKNRFKGINRA